MGRPYHLTLISLFSFLLLTAGLVAADLSGGKKVGKIVTMTIQYPAAGSPPGEKTTISAHYVDEHGGGDRRFDLNCDDDEPLGFAMKYLITTLEGIRDARESRSEMGVERSPKSDMGDPTTSVNGDASKAKLELAVMRITSVSMD
ncbi:hypothetical protein ZWY2020_037610 [Hordeum vulgare]|nr:hypothetical protein ZWY2020_037610 [Hordeum vulgare]